ncbi:MAG: WG repeat-containing protein, partial [Candidatus Gastranaerophilales bacterium]|nr:WG repeat-containing protein [Candidatus Gastranaerophilales bacterium]
LKIKKDNKFGIIDKEGNIILNPVFDKVSVIYDDDKQYLTGKIDGKVKLFYNTGKLIAESEFYTIPVKENFSLVQDMKPVLNDYRKNGNTIYKKTPAEPGSHFVYEIQEIPLRDKVQIAAIEKNAVPNLIDNKNNDLFYVGKKEFIIANNKYKIGLKDKKGNEIIPAIYNKLNVKKPCEHSSYHVIAAEKNHSYTLYDLKGKILAEQVYDKINIYKYGKIYTYSANDGKWELKVNNKLVGNLTLNGNDYNFQKTSLHIRSLHKINELLITILTTE